MSNPRRSSLRNAAGRCAIVAVLSASLPVSLALAGDTAGAPDASDWQRIQAQVTAEVDAGIAAGDPPALTGDLQDIHGMIRTEVVTGDFSDLPPQTAEFGPEFGFSVAISGDWLVVGAPGAVSTIAGNTREHGALFVFHREGGDWVQRQRLDRPGTDAQRCGHSVVLRPPHLVAGCPDFKTESGVQRGLIHVWSLNDAEDTFIYRNARYFDGVEAHCGRALAMTRNYLAISCPLAHNGAGRVYLMKRNVLTNRFDGEPEASLSGVLVPDMDVFNFGDALALYEPAAIGIGPQNVRLAVGAPNTVYPGNIFPRGTVHVYHRALDSATWNATALFRPAPAGTDDAAFASFGSALAMNWNQLVVGAPNNRYGAINTLPGPGSVQRFELSPIVGAIYEWQTREIAGGVNLPGGQHAQMRFGEAIAIAHGNLIAVGAPGTDGTQGNGNPAEAVGLVEFRRTANGDWSVFNYYGEVRPGPINPVLTRDKGQFGRSLDTDVVQRRLVAGYPRSGSMLGLPGEPLRPRGAVWFYETDAIFVDGFQ